MEGRHVDVIEMDAASHTGIDDIREIIEQVRYAPVSARYKVYIIDEVHMLSTQAFNGLLKTLEEPPAHVKFIFATTEIRKVPVTILSRCQRFDLRRVEASVLMDNLRGIAGLEGIAVEDEALAMIARAAEGSVRDAQSIFDQAIAHASGPVTGDAVRAMLGLVDRARVIDLFEALLGGNAAGALAGFRAQYDAGADPSVILADLAAFTHLVTRLKFVPEAANDGALSEDERRRGTAFSQSLSVRVLSAVWQMLLKGVPETREAASPAAAAEMVLIRIAHAADLPTLDEALKQWGEGPQPGSRNGSAPMQGADGAPRQQISSQTVAVQPPAGPVMRLASAQGPVAQAAAQPGMQPAPEPLAIVNSLEDIAALADANRDMAFKVQFKRHVRLVSLEQGKLEIALGNDAPRTLTGDLVDRLTRWTGRRWMVMVSRETGGKTLAEAETAERETVLNDARADPVVSAILSRFPGARIIDVRMPEALAEEGGADFEAAPPPADDETDN